MAGISFKKKTPITVDTILSGFTLGLAQLKALAEANRNVATAKRANATDLIGEANGLDGEANRAIEVVANIERLLAVKGPSPFVETPA